MSQIFTEAFKSQLKPLSDLRDKGWNGITRKRLKSMDKVGHSLRVKHKKDKLPKKVKIKSLEAKLKRLFYPIIKKRDGPVCISCGKKGLVGMDWHAGHFIKAELCNLVYRYDVRNINSQCSACNNWKRGNTIAYRKAMINKYGVLVVDELERFYNSTLAMDFNPREYLLKLIEKYGYIK